MVTRARRSKYNNTRVEADGLKFGSKAEYRHYAHLKVRERAGEISGLKTQVSFDLVPPVTILGTSYRWVRYVADFVYTENGEEKIIDVKGGPMVTDVFKLKKRLMKFLLGKEVIEVRA